MRIPESELIINADGSAFHLHMRPDQLADRVILVGDPSRVALIRQFFDSVSSEGANREMVWFTGEAKGAQFTVLSTGMGTDNIDIVMTELDALANVDFTTRELNPVHRTLNIVRLGTCGAIQPDINIGDFILSHLSVGFDGLLNWYRDRDKVTDPAMEKAFLEHMQWPSNLPLPYFAKDSQKLIDLFADSTVKGMTASACGFYGPQGRSVRCPIAIPDLVDRMASFRYGPWRFTNMEMEGSAIAGLTTLLGHEGITVCCAIAQRHAKAANTDYKGRIVALAQLVIDKLATI